MIRICLTVLTLHLLTFFLGCTSTKKQSAPTSKSKQRNSISSSPLKKQFLNSTGLKINEKWLLENGNEKCIQGRLQINENNDSITLLLGGRPLLTHIKKGLNKYSTKEKECHYRFKVNWRDQRVQHSEERKCKDSKTLVKKDLHIKKDSIRYTVQSKFNGQLNPQSVCILRRIK
jgi:hypothetical protein